MTVFEPDTAGNSDDVISSDVMPEMIVDEGALNFVYALGRISPRFPSLACEQEYYQLCQRYDGVSGHSDHELFARVLTEPGNLYLVRQLYWVLSVQGVEAYFVVPHYSSDIGQFVSSIRPNPDPADLDLVIGTTSPFSLPGPTSPLSLPLLTCDQLYSFDRKSLLNSIPTDDGTSKAEVARLRVAADELLSTVLQLTDNAGAADEHRAVNYLAVRYGMVYGQVSTAHAEGRALAGVDVTISPVSSRNRKVVDVIYTFRHRVSGVVDSWFVRVDVTEEFPFVVTPWSPFYEVRY